MEYKCHVVNPAGNITIFVETEVAKEDYIEVANKLLADKRYQAEQVAFICNPIMGGEARVEMMGGEFCGNATRAFGYLYLSLNNEQSRTIKVEISGSKEVLDVDVNTQLKTARTAMPFPLALDELYIYELDITIPIVVMDGITHAIISDLDENEETTRLILETAKEKLEFDAFGLMYVKGNTMLPIVYVVDTDSLIYEGSCGSGTMAYTVYLTKDLADGKHEYSIKQPGGIIDGYVSKKNNEYIACLMGGFIEITDHVTIEL